MAIKRKIMISISDEDYSKLNAMAREYSKSAIVSEAIRLLESEKIKRGEYIYTGNDI